MVYKVLVTETYQKTVAVEASSEAEAHVRVRDAWSNNEVVLNEDDFQGVECFVEGEAVGDLDKVERKG